MLWNSGLVDVTNNLSSLHVQRTLGNRSRLEKKGTWKDIFKYLAQSGRAFETQDAWIKLGMFWQFDLAFGSDFYAKLCTQYRNMDNPPGTEGEKRQRFILESSRISGFDMTPFFEKWGILVTPETKEEIAGLNLQQLNNGCLPGEDKPIWHKRDEQHVQQNLMQATQTASSFFSPATPDKACDTPNLSM